ncbi:MAG TPA: NAD-dependent epimerase/dehydratase family protein [Myxococcales bacterium]|nr:NAD-dependent epimerase/dehydratase family protein [Myxococcales bacterium]HIN85968.1 NAD-dependent epimerase/dehydratase family protein [Myxococcales bacterium]
MSVDKTVRNVLVLGCGYTGKVLVRKLIAAGTHVTGTTTRAENRDEICGLGADGYVWAMGSELPAHLQQVDTAFVLCPPGTESPEPLAKQLSAVSDVVYCSSTGVYGHCEDGRELTESSPALGNSPRAQARLEAERAFLNIGARIVRAGGIYGPGRNMLERLNKGRVRVAGNLERLVNMIHVEDLATILMAAALRAPKGGVFIATDGLPVRWRDLAETASKLAGIELPEEVELPEDPMLRSFYDSSRRLNNDHTLSCLGIRLAHPSALAALEELAPRTQN